MLRQNELASSSTSFGTTINRRWYLLVKRLLDLLAAISLLVLLAPLLLLIAVLIKLDSHGPIMFKSTRVGRGGRLFDSYRFRTMYVDISPDVPRQSVDDSNKQQTISGKSDENDPTSLIYKLRRNPRVTRFGRLLRRTSLDELPQLLNVLRGDMSLVGPRPPIPYEVEHYLEWHKARLSVLPGLTGLWQIKGHHLTTFDEMVRMDLEYIEHMSLVWDLKILLLTPWAVISGEGAA